MKAIFKREFYSYFRGGVGFAVIALYVFTVSVFASSNNFWGYSNFAYTLYNSTFVYMILIPVLTMRVFSEEKKQKTDKLLYSLPVSSAGIVTAKYLAILSVIGIGAAICGLIPLALCLYGNVDLLQAYAGLFAFFLLGAALAAIGTFISSLTDNQIVAAVATFFVMFISYFLTSVTDLIPAGPSASLAIYVILALILAGTFYLLTKKALISLGVWFAALIPALAVYLISPDSLTGSVRYAAGTVGLFDRFNPFALGILDISALIYYLSVSFAFVFFAGAAFEKRRWN